MFVIEFWSLTSILNWLMQPESSKQLCRNVLRWRSLAVSTSPSIWLAFLSFFLFSSFSRGFLAGLTNKQYFVGAKSLSLIPSVVSLSVSFICQRSFMVSGVSVSTSLCSSEYSMLLSSLTTAVIFVGLFSPNSSIKNYFMKLISFMLKRSTFHQNTDLLSLTWSRS